MQGNKIQHLHKMEWINRFKESALVQPIIDEGPCVLVQCDNNALSMCANVDGRGRFGTLKGEGGLSHER